MAERRTVKNRGKNSLNAAEALQPGHRAEAISRIERNNDVRALERQALSENRWHGREAVNRLVEMHGFGGLAAAGRAISGSPVLRNEIGRELADPNGNFRSPFRDWFFATLDGALTRNEECTRELVETGKILRQGVEGTNFRIKFQETREIELGLRLGPVLVLECPPGKEACMLGIGNLFQINSPNPLALEYLQGIAGKPEMETAKKILRTHPIEFLFGEYIAMVAPLVRRGYPIVAGKDFIRFNKFRRSRGTGRRLNFFDRYFNENGVVAPSKPGVREIVNRGGGEGR